MLRAHLLYSAAETTIFEIMSRLAEACDAINLGQGFPDETAPRELLEKAAEELLIGNNQYPPMAGLPSLRRAVAAHESRHWNLSRDAQSEVLITSGATEALAASILAYVDAGDEVIVFEPSYDCYVPLIRRAGGIPVPVRLNAPSWQLNPDSLRKAISPRTKAVIINNPLNPAAKVYNHDELEVVSKVAQDANAIVIEDAVYEHLVFDGRPYTPIANLPGMNDRTLKIGSAGKIFSLTGWKVGWITGPAELVLPTAKAHQFLTFTTPPNLQSAVAFGLSELDDWLSGLKTQMQSKRDMLAEHLRGCDLQPIPAEGTYFMCVSLAGTKWEGEDLAFSQWTTREAGVAAIPASVFYMDNPEHNVVRFCFAKRDEVLAEAGRRLKRLRDI